MTASDTFDIARKITVLLTGLNEQQVKHSLQMALVDKNMLHLLIDPKTISVTRGVMPSIPE